MDEAKRRLRRRQFEQFYRDEWEPPGPDTIKIHVYGSGLDERDYELAANVARALDERMSLPVHVVHVFP